ncbi:MAG: hypothetical protein ACRDH6_07525 [Actinomycetota bacterium]
MARARRANLRQASGLPDEFVPVAIEVERARATLSGAMPTARREGTAPAEALFAFEAALRQVLGLMDGWRPREPNSMLETWRSCRVALDQCLKAAERLRLEAPPLDFEQQALLFGDLIAPLDAFDEAARILRKTSR